MAGMKKFIGVFATIILVSAICALKFSLHPIAWLIGLIASIPVGAAIAGAFLKSNESQ
jgi:cadmium resistance protein CadD (predicted permease)